MTGFCNGILTAMITPFTDGGVNLKELGRMIDYQIDGGTDAVLPDAVDTVLEVRLRPGALPPEEK